MSIERYIAERLVRTRMKKIHESQDSDEYQVIKTLSDEDLKYEIANIRAKLSVAEEYGRAPAIKRFSDDLDMYEKELKSRTSNIQERMSYEDDIIDQVEDRALEDLGPIKDLEYATSRQGYDLYRCIAHKDNKGHWYAVKDEQIFPITYEQALGYEDIDPSSINRLRKQLGKMLLPSHMREDLTLDDDPEETEQQYTSAATSINSSKLPALFHMVDFEEGSLNLDYGGGRFDNVAEYLESEYGATNLVYDKYNRSAEHNRAVLDQVRKNGGADTVTCSNVLNVIAEESERLAVLRNCKRYLKSGGTCYITVYEGNGKGEGAPTKSGYQLNRKTKDYEEEISRVFSSVTRRGKLFICR